jgi:monoamine oxidase
MHPTGVIVSGYTDELGTPFYDLTLKEKFEASRGSVEKIHPGHGNELRNPVFCGWSRVKWNEGSWIRSYGGGESGYDTIIQADGPIYFAGDTASHIVGWQEGAATSAVRAVKMISNKVKAARLAGAPNGVVQG